MIAKRRKTFNKQQAGFTLVELIIGLIVISIISGVLAWNGSYLLKTYRARQAVREVAGMINFARAQALNTRRFHMVEITPWGGTNPFDAQRGQVRVIRGSSASIISAFTTGTSVVADYQLARQYNEVAISRLHSNGDFTQAGALPILRIMFSPNGRICEGLGTFPNFTACLATSYVVVMRQEVVRDPGSNNFVKPARLLRLSSSGQLRLEVVDTGKCTNTDPGCDQSYP